MIIERLIVHRSLAVCTESVPENLIPSNRNLIFHPDNDHYYLREKWCHRIKFKASEEHDNINTWLGLGVLKHKKESASALFRQIRRRCDRIAYKYAAWQQISGVPSDDR